MNYLSMVGLTEKAAKKEEKEKQGTAEPRIVCPGCQKTLADFRDSGRLGCAQCYATFQDKIGELIEKVQKSDQHRGKVPQLSSMTYHRQVELLGYRRKLRAAVRNEEFEEAARLRDRIKTLEEDLLQAVTNPEGTEDLSLRP